MFSVVVDNVVARYTRVALLEPTDCLVDLVAVLQESLLDALLQSLKIVHQATLVL